MRERGRATANARRDPPLTAEWSLLVACAREAAGLATGGGHPASAPAPAAVDWQLLLELADRHGLTLFLNRYVDRAPTDVPDPVRDRLRDRARLRARENLRLIAALVELTAAMEAAGIPVAAYKGPALSVQLFGDPSLRDYDDLDLLVRERDVSPATELLRQRGLKPWFEVPADRERHLAGSQYARHFGDAATGVAVDLHWGFSQPYLSFAIAEETLWADTRAISLGGASIRTLPPRLLLLVLCVHGSKHEPSPWYRLKWVLDVAALMQRLEPREWDALLADARALRLERPVLFGLLVANRLLGAPLAPAALDRVRATPVLDRLADAALATLTTPPQAGPEASRVDYDLRLLDRRRDRFRYVLHRLFVPNPKDWATLKLPVWLAPAYYLLRPVRLLRKAMSGPRGQ